jgi:pimeloyl-ACP methyl ester carboxylesterase
VFLHGWSGCARQLVHAGPTPCRDGDPPREGWGLADRVDASGTDALFVVPQLAFLRRDGSPGHFADGGRFAAFLTELIASLRPVLGAEASVDDLESISLFAHSAGFETALAILAHGSVDVAHVVLFDALYRGVEPFTSWAAGSPNRKLVSLYTGGRTERQSRMLAFSARRALGADAVSLDDERLAQAIATHRVTVARSPAHHADVPAHHLPELLPALGLSARP